MSRFLVTVSVVALVLLTGLSPKVEAAACKGNEFQKGDSCVACNDANFGLANCAICSNENSVFKCTSCIDGFYFPDLQKNSTCAECNANCYGGTCSGADASKSIVSKCTSCLATYFLKADGTCDTCKVGCRVCSSPTTCSVCSIAGQLPQRPDAGDCDACKSPNAVGFEGSNEVCGPVPAIQQIPAQINSTDNMVSLNNLCAPTVAANSAKENVGAILIFGPSAESSINVRDVLTAIRKGQVPAVSEEEFAKKDRILSSLEKIWVYVAGTSSGSANISSIRVFKGNSILSYVCLNAFNVKSEIRTAKIVNNQSINMNVQFRAKLSRPLVSAELNNLTCLLSKALKISPATRLINQQGISCNASQSARLLQAAASNGSVRFTAIASQLEDDFEAKINSMAGDVNATFSDFAAGANLTIVQQPYTVSFDKSAQSVSPKLNPTLSNSSQSSLSIAFTSDVNALVHFALTNYNQTITENELYGNSNKTLEVGRLALKGSSPQIKLFSNLNAQTQYKVFYSAESISETPMATGLMNTIFTTNGTQGAQSFAAASDINTFILIFLLLISLLL